MVKRLDLHILYLYLARGSWHLGGKHREEVTAFINLCIDDLHTKYDLEDLEKFLDKNKYFNTRAPASFYIKGRLHNKMGEQTKFLDEIGDISNFISANSQAKRNQITAVILQVAEAYISSRLLVKAKDVLLEAETLSKNQIEVYQIKMYIEKILGASKNVDEQSKKYYDIILNSNEFKLESQIMEKKIFLVRDKIVKINIPEEFDKKISSKHIMQVFVDGDIRFESYVSKLSRTIIVNVPKPRSFSPHIINIKIL